MSSETTTGDGGEPSGKNSNEEVEVDNSRSVLVRIATLYAEQLMSDITLEVGGVGFPAHRLILCVSSPVFQVMLMNREWSESQESRVVLQETAPCAAVFPHFLRYFYTGQIKISQETVLPVLSLADKYNVKDLASLCLCYMSQHVAHAAQHGQLIAWMHYTASCGHEAVAQACLHLLKWNMEWVWESGDLSAMEPDLLVHLLQQNDLVVHNEITLFNLVASWLLQQRERLLSPEAGLSEEEALAHWNSLVPLVLVHVRFPMMCPRQLAKLVLNPLANDHKDFFMERMAIAMNYQYGHAERTRSVRAAESGRIFTPRLYTEDAWGTVLTIDNLHSLPCYHTRTFIFSTRPKISESTSEKTCEWTLDLYPKGVWFRKSLLIAWYGTYDVPEVVLRTVRIAITCQNPPAPDPDPHSQQLDEPDIRVKIGILVWGVRAGVEHVSMVVERVHRFSAHTPVLNIDNALDFDELNMPLYTPGARAAPGPAAVAPAPSKCAHCAGRCCVTAAGGGGGAGDSASHHLLGPNREQLKIQVVMVPLTDECEVAAET